MNLAKREAELAKSALQAIEDSDAKMALIGLADLSVNRSS
jgi:geranylgeranyl pyrophosphate synthase